MMQSFADLLKRLYSQDVVNVLVHGDQQERETVIKAIQETVNKALEAK